MIIVLKQHAPDEKVKAFCNELQTMGYQINDSMGSDTHILGLIGDTKALSESWVLANPVVETCRRVSEPYKKANRKFHPDDTVVEVGDKKIKVGGGHFAVMAGPCSVESKEQITFVAQRVQAAGASILRGGAFKPRTSPYSFQGLRAEGLELLAHARSQTGQPIVTELMNSEHIPLFEETGVDMIQIGARNMQNFELLKAVGRTNIPVLLKRGLSATLEELVMSAEYIMAEGNPNVVLCERGIRTFETSMRNTLDISAVPMLKKMTHLPVVIDPSHAAGIAFMVPSLAKAAVAVGAVGLHIHGHIHCRRVMAATAVGLDNILGVFGGVDDVGHGPKFVHPNVVKSGGGFERQLLPKGIGSVTFVAVQFGMDAVFMRPGGFGHDVTACAKSGLVGLLEGKTGTRHGEHSDYKSQKQNSPAPLCFGTVSLHGLSVDSAYQVVGLSRAFGPVPQYSNLYQISPPFTCLCCLPSTLPSFP